MQKQQKPSAISEGLDLLSSKVPLTFAATAVCIVVSTLITYGGHYMNEKSMDATITAQIQAQNANTEKRLDYNMRLREDLESRTKRLEIESGKIGAVVTIVQGDVSDTKKDVSDVKRMVIELLVSKRLEETKKAKRGTASTEFSSDSQTHQ